MVYKKDSSKLQVNIESISKTVFLRYCQCPRSNRQSVASSTSFSSLQTYVDELCSLHICTDHRYFETQTREGLLKYLPAFIYLYLILP